jgi:membrane associated rhomboid family serine protease
MLKSIADDIKRSFQSGNVLTRIILINIFVFLVIAIIRSFSPGAASNEFYQDLIALLAVPAEPLKLLLRPWTIVTHMFVHEGFWHLFWNLLVLYWFGQISGDLLGDRKVLPIYFYGGIAGALAFFIFCQIYNPGHSMALGASAAVMAIVLSAAITSPDYRMHLILIGPVAIKYIAIAFVIIDLLSVANSPNSGGHIAHLGGAFFGAYFVYLLRSGIDLSQGFNNFIKRVKDHFRADKKSVKKSPLTVYHKKTTEHIDHQEKLDQILDKIKHKGYDSLTEEEKEFLFQASKK